MWQGKFLHSLRKGWIDRNKAEEPGRIDLGSASEWLIANKRLAKEITAQLNAELIDENRAKNCGIWTSEKP